MANDKAIGDLPLLSSITDSSLLPVEQSGTAYKTNGGAWKQFVRNAVADDVASASTDASTAEYSAQIASAAAADAQAAQQKIENMTVTGVVLPSGATPTVTKSESGGVVALQFGLVSGPKGDTGATGPAGPAGTVTNITYQNTYNTVSAEPTSGTIYFSINDQGHLILTYAAGDIDPNDPPYMIDYDEGSPTYGHLLWVVDD